MKRAIWFGLLAIALVLPVTASAERHAWSRQDDGSIVEVRRAAPLSFGSRFGLSTEKLNVCSADGAARYQLDLTADEGIDLLTRDGADLQSLLTPALFKANAALLAPQPGVDLTDPEDVQRLNRPTRRFADVRVDGRLADLRLQIFGGSGACAPTADAGGDDMQRVTAAAAEDSCEGACDCTTCVCSGSESCCDAGCNYCWGYLDGSGSC